MGGGGGGWKRSTNLAIFFVGMLGHHTRVKFPIDVKLYSINTDDNQGTTLTFLSSRVIDSNKVPFFPQLNADMPFPVAVFMFFKT